MGCVHSVPAASKGSSTNADNNGKSSFRTKSGRPARTLSQHHTPSQAQLAEGVLSEMLRSRRRSIRSSQDYDADTIETIAQLSAMGSDPAHQSQISEPEQDCIVQALQENVLFSCMNHDQLLSLARLMSIQIVEPGETVVTQGEIGDKFFVVRSGRFEVVNAHGDVINRLSAGATFGELGLLYSAKRTANVIADAKVRGSLYTLQGSFFRYIAAKHSIETFQSSLEVLRKVPLLTPLTEEQLSLVANSAQPLLYRGGDVIVHKDEPGSVLYMIHSGTVVCTDIGNGGATLELSDGDFFGERALLASEPRAATVIAKTDVRLLAIDQRTFQLVLGPLQTLLQETRVWRALESVSVLREVPYPLKKKLLAAARVVQYEENHVIFHQDDAGDAFYIIKDGEVRIVQLPTRNSETTASVSPLGEQEARQADATSSLSSIQLSLSPDAKPLEVARLGAGDMFGEMALLQQGPTKRSASVVAASRVECIVLERAAFEQICASARDDLEELARRRTLENYERSFVLSLSVETLEKLGVLDVGSEGSVIYAARHTPTQRIVAVKEVWKSRLEHNQHVTSSRREKRLLAHLESPFVLKYFTTLQDERKVYIVTELLLGGKLFQRIVESSGRSICLAMDHARFYTASCALALGYLHEQYIVYRDLKPENIFLDHLGYTKLVDFAFAKKLAGKTYTLVGTPEYLAPEIILGVGHGLAADAWSLGVLLYEMVMGESPFATKDQDHLSICRNILLERIRFPEDADENWKELVLSLLDKTPEKRPSLVPSLHALAGFDWFQGFDWNALTHRTMPAPWKPTATSEQDVTACSFVKLSNEQLSDLEAPWNEIEPAWSWEKF
ncbi:hypothetical protein Poli38472_014357 [Pythium oligandrum]|uniref:cGMP-dependent protein kinase n=1 Tax=Pythium oligandrum TaxID=41045 RepID=A0A8K1C785_PYTOL|nr:hypothetical protein Poli38472_014357 [Pythium oligandrum]|eukprot:TMW57754.1 hypothetical protein Poli38472_014357 [Pythium oligandrum]